MPVTVNEDALKEQITGKCQRAYAKGYAEGIMNPKQPTVVADYCRLELYEHDYHHLLAKWLVEKEIAIADIEVEFYATYCEVNGKIIPYDVQFSGTEAEQLVVWV